MKVISAGSMFFLVILSSSAITLGSCSASSMCTPTAHEAWSVSAFEPEPAQGVVDYVPHYPIRGEKLCGGGDAILRSLLPLPETLVHLILPFGDVVLVEPSHYLHLVAPIFFRYFGDYVANHRAFGKSVPGE